MAITSNIHGPISLQSKGTKKKSHPSAKEGFSPGGWPKGESGAYGEYQKKKGKGPSTRRKGKKK